MILTSPTSSLFPYTTLFRSQFPFSLFETYRENVQGKYWFPDYSRSDDTLDLKGQQIPVRIVIKWTDFTPLPAAPRSEEHTSELQSHSDLVCRLLLEKKKYKQ